MYVIIITYKGVPIKAIQFSQQLQSPLNQHYDNDMTLKNLCNKMWLHAILIQYTFDFKL